ncbi:LuxR C-terminal-related transcriptional regulator [Sphingopyxis fribergensis]
MVLERQLLCRSGLASIIRREFRDCDVAMAETVEQAVAWLDVDLRPALLVIDGGIDLALANIDGIRGLSRRFPEILVAVVDWRRDRGSALQAITDGAQAYIPKDLERDEMLHAFRQVMAGQVYIPSTINDVEDDMLAPASVAPHPASLSGLTGRQREVLTHMSMGKSNKEIGRSLRISESTVKVHVAAAFRQLGVHNRVGAVAMLQQRGNAAAFLREQLLGVRPDHRDPPKRAFG